MAMVGAAAVTDANISFLGAVDVHLGVWDIIRTGGNSAESAVENLSAHLGLHLINGGVDWEGVNVVLVVDLFAVALAFLTFSIQLGHCWPSVGPPPQLCDKFPGWRRRGWRLGLKQTLSRWRYLKGRSSLISSWISRRCSCCLSSPMLRSPGSGLHFLSWATMVSTSSCWSQSMEPIPEIDFLFQHFLEQI